MELWHSDGKALQHTRCAHGLKFATPHPEVADVGFKLNAAVLYKLFAEDFVDKTDIADIAGIDPTVCNIRIVRHI